MENDPEQRRARQRAATKRYNEANPDARRKSNTKHRTSWMIGRRDEYLAYRRHHSALRRARQACPAWVDAAALKEIHRHCPADHHVDPIVPLKGKRVCGLHVRWNLQYLKGPGT